MINIQCGRSVCRRARLALSLGLALLAPVRGQPMGEEKKNAKETGAAQPPKEYAATYFEPFRGPPKNADDFTLIGVEAPNFVKYGLDGLRITLPPGSKYRTPPGVATTFGVAGDFEITLRYEVLEESSFTLRVHLNKPAAKDNFGQLLAYDASVAFNKGDATLPLFLQISTMRKDAVRQADRSLTAFGVKEKSGRFRLVRTGENLSYYLSEGLEKEFKLLQTHPFGADDLKDIQIYGQTGRNPTLDVRFTDLDVRAASLPRQAAPPNDYALEYLEPFKGPPKKPADFTLVGTDAAKYVKFEPEGLRITLPAGKTRQPTGVATTFGVVGDFDVSVRYEILAEPEPKDAGTPKIGTRISLTANGSGKNNDASIRRKIPPGGTVHILTYTNADKLGEAFPVREKSGRFRLVRTGDMIAFYLSEGSEKGFHLLRTHPFNGADLKELQISAQTSSPNAVLDARFTDLHIRAASVTRLLAPPKTEKANQPPPPKIDEPKIPTKDYVQKYFQPFKGGGGRPDGWKFASRLSEQHVQFEPAGLRIALPPGGPEKGQTVGIQSDFGVKGDFEVTLSFEVLKDPEPADAGKLGTRFSMAIHLDTPLLDTPKSEVAYLSRNMRSRGFSAWMRSRDQPSAAPDTFAIPVTTGRLRLVRRGDELFYLASVGADQPFTFLKKSRFGAEDLQRIGISATTGGEKAQFDVRVTDFRIRADAIPGAPPSEAGAQQPGQPAEPVAAPPQERSRNWLVALLLVGASLAFLLALGVGAILVLRKRGGPEKALSNRAGPTAHALVCPKCARILKTPAQMAGKKVKCKECGAIVQVPA